MPNNPKHQEPMYPSKPKEIEGRGPDDIDRRFASGTARMDRIEAMIQANTADTAEVLEIIKLGKSFFKMIGYVGKFVKFVAPIGASLVGVYYAIKTGGDKL